MNNNENNESGIGLGIAQFDNEDSVGNAAPAASSSDGVCTG
jgi:hypothetical protein